MSEVKVTRRYEFILANSEYRLRADVNHMAKLGWRLVTITHAVSGAYSVYTAAMEIED